MGIEKSYTPAEVEKIMMMADRSAILDVVHLLRRSAKLDVSGKDARNALMIIADAIEGQPRGINDVKRAIERWLKVSNVL